MLLAVRYVDKASKLQTKEKFNPPVMGSIIPTLGKIRFRGFLENPTQKKIIKIWIILPVKFGVDKVFYVSGLKNLVCWIFHFL
jgi:hypothetical protein